MGWLQAPSEVHEVTGSSEFIRRISQMFLNRLSYPLRTALPSRLNGAFCGPMEVLTGSWEDGKSSKITPGRLCEWQESTSISLPASSRNMPDGIWLQSSNLQKMPSSAKISPAS